MHDELQGLMRDFGGAKRITSIRFMSVGWLAWGEKRVYQRYFFMKKSWKKQ